MWRIGDRLRHRFNPELGAGRVESIDGRTLVVLFPDAGHELRIAAGSDALEPLTLAAGARAKLQETGEAVVVDRILGAGRVRLTDGRELGETELWPTPTQEGSVDRLARGDVDRLDRFAMRLDALHLAGIREADGLGSFLGGRIRLFPHQLHAAERATRSDPVRWLLADEVGLGKTVEACLILDHLLRTGRVDRTLIVAPETLVVQWLGELWRKYHQVFVLLDDQRLTDVERDYGEGFNPFDAYRRVVVGADFLTENPWLTRRAVEAGIDLLIVDEAHHLRRPRGHPGNPLYRALEPISAIGRHVLLLTATPLEEDAFGFLRLLQILRPETFPDDEAIEAWLSRPTELPPCTSATRRVDIGGLPPREASAVARGADADWSAMLELEQAVRERRPGNELERRRKADRIRRALSSGPSLSAVLGRDEKRLADLAARAAHTDPRLTWLAEQSDGWKSRGDKTLVFVAERETLEWLRDELSRRVQLRTGVFHEDLTPAQRDIEVARFRLESGPSLLISTECGGEGRNFEFCTRLVLFDLPWNPMTVEQRIGRLDRIGRVDPVEIAYFRPPAGVGHLVAGLFEQLGLFRLPLGGIERELAAVRETLRDAVLADGPLPPLAAFEDAVADTRRAHERVRERAYQQLHRDGYRPEQADSILDRVPDELDELNADTALAIAEHLELDVETHRDGRCHSVELGTSARVASLPGVAPGAAFLGSFDREEAVADDGIDYFAAGHPLVEGLLSHLEESPAGRVALLHARSPDGGEAFGLLAIYRRGAGFHAAAVDATGRERPEWAEVLSRRPLRSRRVVAETWTSQPGWAGLVRKLAATLERHGEPEAIAAFRLD